MFFLDNREHKYLFKIHKWPQTIIDIIYLINKSIQNLTSCLKFTKSKILQSGNKQHLPELLTDSVISSIIIWLSN
jgi:hypothetical protein